MSEQYKLTLFTVLTKDALGAAIGKDAKAGAAILDKGFAAVLRRILDERQVSSN